MNKEKFIERTIIEKLKNNETLFSRLGEKEIACFKAVGKKNCVWWTCFNEWKKFNDVAAESSFQSTCVYRIHKDYEVKEEKGYVKQAVLKSAVFGESALGVMLPTGFCPLGNCANLPNFMFYEYSNGNKSCCSRAWQGSAHAALYPDYVVFRNNF